MKKILFSLMKHTFKFENIIEFIFKINKKILNLYNKKNDFLCSISTYSYIKY